MSLTASELLWGKKPGNRRGPEDALARGGEEDRREGQGVRLPCVHRSVDAEHRSLHLRRGVDAEVLVGDQGSLEVRALDVDALAGDDVVQLALGAVQTAVAVRDDHE